MKIISSLLLTILGLTSAFTVFTQFENPLDNLDYAYSEKAIGKSIREAADSRQMRIEQAFLNASGEGLREGMVPYFANLWLGKDLKETNEILLDILTTEDTGIQEKYRFNDPCCLANNQLLYHMYYSFGSKGTVFPGRIYPETEKAMLEFLWEHLEYKNDIHLARKSTRWMIGSENHDLGAKVSSLITSQIYMNEPEFKDRIYLDKTVVPGFHVLRYKGCGENAEEIYLNLANNEMPMVGGKRVNYAPDMLFNSPYIKSKYKSGMINISKDDQKLVLDFNI